MKNNKYVKYILNFPLVRAVLRWSKSYSPPGFSGVSVFNVIDFVVKELKKDNITTRSNSVAFSLFLSIFPAIIFIFALLPMFPIVKDYTMMLNDYLKEALPSNAHNYLFTIINDITSIKRDGLLSVGAILALYFSSNGMLTLMMGFDKAQNEAFHVRPWWRSRVVAFVLTVILLLLMVVSLLITIVEDTILEWLRTTLSVSETLLNFASLFNWLFAIFVIYTGISLIYTFGPSMYRRIRFINVGSIVATLLMLLASLGFSFFIDNFGRYNEIYGSIGALIVFLVWLQFNSMILLIGFELNTALVSQLYIEKKKQEREKIKS